MFYRRIFGAFLLAFGLLLGQQAAAVHDLSHATEQLGQKAPTPKHACDQCFLGAQLSGAVGTYVAGLPQVAPGHVDALAFSYEVELPAPRLSFLTRAPPVLL